MLSCLVNTKLAIPWISLGKESKPAPLAISRNRSPRHLPARARDPSRAQRRRSRVRWSFPHGYLARPARFHNSPSRCIHMSRSGVAIFLFVVNHFSAGAPLSRRFCLRCEPLPAALAEALPHGEAASSESLLCRTAGSSSSWTASAECRWDPNCAALLSRH